MDPISRPSAASATGWRKDVFFHARLKLTVMYLAVIAVILALFSAALYLNVASEVREAVQRSPLTALDEDDAFFDEQAERLLWTIFFADAAILVISAVTSYAFAGLTLRPIRSAMDAQERFASDAAHELRTPLAVMRTQLEVLLRGKEVISPKTRATLESVLDESRGLAGITEDLLFAARDQAFLRSGSSLQDVELGGIVARTVDGLRTVAEARQIRIVVKDGPTVSVRGEITGLRRVLANVVENAIKYSEQNGTIDVSWREEPGGWVCISVTDAGHGISKENIPHIFERFYKADNARQDVGSGLGLFIVKQIVETYGGTVSATSELGRGTTVSIRLKASS